MAATIVTQQQKIEGLTEKVIRLETALEIGLARSFIDHDKHGYPAGGGSQGGGLRSSDSPRGELAEAGTEIARLEVIEADQAATIEQLHARLRATENRLAEAQAQAINDPTEMYRRWLTETRYYYSHLGRDLLGDWVLTRMWGGRDREGVE